MTSTEVVSVNTRPKSELSIMQKRKLYSVIYNGEDLTPENIIDSDFAVMEESFKHAAFDNVARGKDDSQLKPSKTNISRSRTGIALENAKVFATTINLDEIHIDHTLNTEEGIVDDSIDLEQAPSAYYLPKTYPVTKYPPEIIVILKETDTSYLFELTCITYDKGSMMANIVEEENAYYEYITVGKGRNRKMVVEETQSEAVTTQTRHTLAVRPKKSNAMSFASMWDMHDTYARLATQTKRSEGDEMVLYQSAAPTLLRKKRRMAATVKEQASKTFVDIGTTPAFLDAVLLTERVLASLEYGAAQKIFRGLIKMDPLAKDLLYIYTMKPLWVLECPETLNRPIISLSFNPKNKDILGVAYGKYVYAEECTGIVCVWCTKNPCKPERLYRFDSPVTAVSFSEKNPNWLACGFWNGDVIILDISSYTIKTKAMSNRETNPCFEPIWVTNWRDVDKDLEFLMTCCEDGRINRFVSTKTHEFICTPMMRVSTAEGKLKGLETPKPCLKIDVPISRYPGVLCMIWHPHISHIYYVGTNEGCVHKCSTHYLNQHIDVFKAHSGPVYEIGISPFHQELYLTAGADGAVRLWIDGVDEMIMTMACSAAVHGAVFCPTNATIVVTVSGNVMSIWDLRRKTHAPCADYTFPGNVVLTYVKFSAGGENVFVSDSFGKIHTFHLEDTPIPPFYQRKILEETIRNALCTRPQLLKQLLKLNRISPN